jgi:glycerol-3-phosphate acyltransferase PlsY
VIVLLLFALLVPTGYLLGAVPLGLVIGRLVKGVDVRQYGSGNVGATNVLRTVGVKAAALVLVLDLGKGALMVVVAHLIGAAANLEGTYQNSLEVACAIAALVGHNWSIFIAFRGGRGTATGLGALFLLAPWAGLVAACVGVSIIALGRYVSLGSITGAVVGGTTVLVMALLGFYPLAYGVYGVLGLIIVVFQHISNIRRLLDGTELRLGQPASPIGSVGNTDNKED